MSLIPQIPSEFHRFFAGWARLEPRCRSEDFARGLQAATADPLWMLGRQWQLGELEAEDAGSPVDAVIRYRNALITGLEVDTTSIPLTAPLEALVECETVAWDWSLRLKVGQRFERLLRAELPTAGVAEALIGAYRKHAAYRVAPPVEKELVELDRATQRFRRLMAGRAIDGEKLLKLPSLPPVPLPAGVTQAQVDRILQALRTWFDSRFVQPGPGAPTAWRPEYLDYAFKLRAPTADQGDIVLSSPSYRNGELDWYSCVYEPSGRPPGKALSKSDPLLPTRVGFPGMPHRRWWAFEDSRVDFGDLEVGTPDMVKLALIEFAVVYADDWFVVPLPVPAGSVTEVRELEILDVFGQPTTVTRGRTIGADLLDRWEMFAPSVTSGDGGGAPFLVVPPAMGIRDESPPIEEVRFLRDEDANLVWAIEHTVPNGLGTPVSGFDAHLERQALGRERHPPGAQAAGASAPSGAPRYLLATKVPAPWIPFLPADANAVFNRTNLGRHAVRLLRAQMLRNEGDATPAAVPSASRLLDPSSAEPLVWLEEGAVPREGVRAELTWQRVRGPDGATYIWLGRRIDVGRGEGRSGLRFDIVKSVGS